MQEKILKSKVRTTLFVFTVTLVVMTAYEATKQFIFGQYLTLWYSHVITIVFTSSLASLIAWGLVVKLHAFYERNKDTALYIARIDTHKATMSASYRYLNNLLNNFQLIQLEVEEDGHIKQQTLMEISITITKISQELHELEAIDDPTQFNINQFISKRL